MTPTREELIAEAKQAITEYMDSGVPNQWLHLSFGDFYVRSWGYHNFFGESHRTFDIGNVQIHSKFQGHGLFSEILEWITSAHKHRYTYVQSILNQKLAASLLKKGWIQLPSVEVDVNMVMENPAWQS